MKKLHVIFSVIIALYGALYLNYNLPVLQQLFAHHFYVETEATKIRTRGFGCINVNVQRAESFADRNESILLGGSIAPNVKYEYEVEGVKYAGTVKSYIERFFRCQYVVFKAYYFPLYPAWSVVENHKPDTKYIANFYSSSAKFIILILVYVLFLISKKVLSKS